MKVTTYRTLPHGPKVFCHWNLTFRLFSCQGLFVSKLFPPTHSISHELFSQILVPWKEFEANVCIEFPRMKKSNKGKSESWWENIKLSAHCPAEGEWYKTQDFRSFKKCFNLNEWKRFHSMSVGLERIHCTKVNDINPQFNFFVVTKVFLNLSAFYFLLQQLCNWVIQKIFFLKYTCDCIVCFFLNL